MIQASFSNGIRRMLQGKSLSNDQIFTAVDCAIQNKQLPYATNGVYILLGASNVKAASGKNSCTKNPARISLSALAWFELVSFWGCSVGLQLSGPRIESLHSLSGWLPACAVASALRVLRGLLTVDV